MDQSSELEFLVGCSEAIFDGSPNFSIFLSWVSYFDEHYGAGHPEKFITLS